MFTFMVLWHIDPLLGNDRETKKRIAIVMQEFVNTQQYWNRC
jgi:hypothetical protein